MRSTRRCQRDPWRRRVIRPAAIRANGSEAKVRNRPRCYSQDRSIRQRHFAACVGLGTLSQHDFERNRGGLLSDEGASPVSLTYKTHSFDRAHRRGQVQSAGVTRRHAGHPIERHRHKALQPFPARRRPTGHHPATPRTFRAAGKHHGEPVRPLDRAQGRPPSRQRAGDSPSQGFPREVANTGIMRSATSPHLRD